MIGPAEGNLRRSLAALALALPLGVSSCDADRITSSDMGLALETSVSDASIGPGETATISYRLRNVGRVPRTVDIACTFLPYIKDGKGALVYPGGAWGCYAIVVPPITLAPGEEIARTLVVNGAPPLPSGSSTVKLPPGRYTVYVEFTGALVDARRRVELRSRDVRFEITG